MKIEDVIAKCVETPGISVKQEKYFCEMLLNTKEGTGSMTFLPLFPGITLAYISIDAPTWPAPQLAENGSNVKGPLLINYCIQGRCELVLNNDSYVYVTDGQLSLTERFAQNQYIYPRRLYQGLELFLDVDSTTAAPYLADSLGLFLPRLAESYCPDGKTYIAQAGTSVETLFHTLWGLAGKRNDYALFQMRMGVLSLLGALLYETHIPPSRTCTFYTESQVAIAKKTEAIITADLRKHHPAWELAAAFSISETSLKNYFRGVFGQNLSVYLQELRMNRAADLLVSTRLSVAAIAEQVGYTNQSKFAHVFKRKFGVSPLEYRRHSRLAP